jgi:predicted small lipoprotein YifL
MKRTFSTLVIALIVAVSLGACGKKSPPKAPGGESQYPQQYPKQQ